MVVEITTGYIVSLMSFGALIVCLLYVGNAFFRAAKEREFNKRFLSGLGLFMVTFAISTVLWLVNDYLNFGSFDNITYEFFLGWRLANIAIYLSLFILIYSIESLVLKKIHHILSFLILTIIPIYLFAPWDISYAVHIDYGLMQFKSPFSMALSYYFVIVLNIGLLTIMLVYLYLAIKQKGDMQKRSLMIAFAVFCIWLGRMTAYRMIDPVFMSEDLEMILGPIIMILGTVLLYQGYHDLLKGTTK
jgi:hypothetical protein